MRWNWKDRAFAAALHLTASLLVAALAAVLVLGIWFPYPYRHVAGGMGLFTLMVSVDVVLGPLLTFAVFNRAKPRSELVRDMGVIVLLQVGALVYGLTTAFQARPVYLVYEVDRFRTVVAADIDRAELAEAPAELRDLPWHGVPVIGTRAPKDNQEMLASLEASLAGRDVGVRPGWWQSLNAENQRQMRSKARTLELVRVRAGSRVGELDELVARSGVPADQVIVLPLVGREGDWAALLDARDLRIIGYFPVDAF